MGMEFRTRRTMTWMATESRMIRMPISTVMAFRTPSTSIPTGKTTVPVATAVPEGLQVLVVARTGTVAPAGKAAGLPTAMPEARAGAAAKVGAKEARVEKGAIPARRAEARVGNNKLRPISGAAVGASREASPVRVVRVDNPASQGSKRANKVGSRVVNKVVNKEGVPEVSRAGAVPPVAVAALLEVAAVVVAAIRCNW